MCPFPHYLSLLSLKLTVGSAVQVMLFSFMGGTQGRILQAYTNNEGLVIQKSKLYDFSTLENFREFINLFLRYLTSNAVGDTQQTGR